MKIPNNWSEVSLNSYIAICELSSVDMDELDKKVKILSILTGETEESISSLSLPDLKRAIGAISFLNKLEAPEGVPTSVILNKETFTVNNNVRKLSGGEYISLAEWTKDKDKITQNLPDIISLFLKPSGSQWYYKNAKGEMVQTLESLQRNKELAGKYLTMDKVLQLTNFFLLSSIALTEATHNYLIQENRKKMDKTWKALKKVSQDLYKSGAGYSR